VGKIGVMADKETAIYFKLGGADTVFDWIKDKVGQGKKEIELPLVVSIPTRRGGKAQVDLLAELIKRTVGVEIRVQ